MADINTKKSYKKVASFIRTLDDDNISISTTSFRSKRIDGVPLDSLFYNNCLRMATMKLNQDKVRKFSKRELCRHVRSFYDERAQARLINDARVLSDEEFNKKYVSSKEEIFDGTNKILSTSIAYETKDPVLDEWEEF